MNACVQYVDASVTDLMSGLRVRGYERAVVDEGVEGTWFQNEVAQLTQQVDQRFHLGSRESDAWKGILRLYFSGSTLRKLSSGNTLASDRAVRSSVERWCLKG
jgi:hypothetical protein